MTRDEVEKILKKICLETDTLYTPESAGEISCITYYVDRFDCGDTEITNRHIDLEYCYGEFLELHEGENLYQYIYEVCNLQEAEAGEEGLVLYQAQE